MDGLKEPGADLLADSDLFVDSVNADLFDVDLFHADLFHVDLVNATLMNSRTSSSPLSFTHYGNGPAHSILL